MIYTQIDIYIYIYTYKFTYTFFEFSIVFLGFPSCGHWRADMDEGMISTNLASLQLAASHEVSFSICGRGH